MLNFRYLEDAAILRLDLDKCIGCGNCALVCPHRIFALKDGRRIYAVNGGRLMKVIAPEGTIIEFRDNPAL